MTCLIAGIGSASADEGMRLYRDDRLKIAFELPADWERRACKLSEEGIKCLELRPRSRRKSPDPSVVIEVKDATLEESASRHVLFEKRGVAWIKHGRFGESEASPISGPNWRGIEASASCGVSDEETGFHAGAGTCYTAILSNGTRSAVIETDGFESTLDTADAITKSFRFLK